MLDPAVAPRLSELGARFVITGAGGWLGMATLDLLKQALGADFSDRVCCFGSCSRDLVLLDGAKVRQQPLHRITALPHAPTCVLHYAFLTKDRAEHMDEAHYRAANEAISKTVLDALDKIGAQKLFLASSGAAKYADVDTTSPAMRLYGAMKLADEARFAAWAENAERRAVIGRIYSITGPYINKHQAYAFASFILDGLTGRSIGVRAPRRVIRSYVPIRELLSLIFALLLDGRSGVVRFDSGGQALELAEVAAEVAKFFPGSVVERAPIRDLNADRYHGDGAAYSALLHEHGMSQLALGAQVEESVAYLRAVKLGGATGD